MVAAAERVVPTFHGGRLRERQFASNHGLVDKPHTLFWLTKNVQCARNEVDCLQLDNVEGVWMGTVAILLVQGSDKADKALSILPGVFVGHLKSLLHLGGCKGVSCMNNLYAMGRIHPRDHNHKRTTYQRWFASSLDSVSAEVGGGWSYGAIGVSISSRTPPWLWVFLACMSHNNGHWTMGSPIWLESYWLHICLRAWRRLGLCSLRIRDSESWDLSVLAGTCITRSSILYQQAHGGPSEGRSLQMLGVAEEGPLPLIQFVENVRNDAVRRGLARHVSVFRDHAIAGDGAKKNFL
eukprot:824871-Pelagomonas_calceolata.AAC.3